MSTITKSHLGSAHDEADSSGWCKSTYSMSAGECVEIKAGDHKFAIRDSKAPETGHLTLLPGCFQRLLADIKQGLLDT
jgi:hypothetical protein